MCLCETNTIRFYALSPLSIVFSIVLLKRSTAYTIYYIKSLGEKAVL